MTAAFPVTIPKTGDIAWAAGASWDVVRRWAFATYGRDAYVGPLCEAPRGVEVVTVPPEPTMQERAEEHAASIRRAVWREALELFEDSVSDRELRGELLRRAGLHDDHREARHGS